MESRTFIVSEKEEDAGPADNWTDPVGLEKEVTGCYYGSMKGHTAFVVSLCMDPITDPEPKLGVQLTDSEYVIFSIRVMTRMG